MFVIEIKRMLIVGIENFKSFLPQLFSLFSLVVSLESFILLLMFIIFFYRILEIISSAASLPDFAAQATVPFIPAKSPPAYIFGFEV